MRLIRASVIMQPDFLMKIRRQADQLWDQAPLWAGLIPLIRCKQTNKQTAGRRAVCVWKVRCRRRTR